MKLLCFVALVFLACFPSFLYADVPDSHNNRMTPVHTLRGHTDSVLKVAFSRDGTRLLSASADHTVRLWNVETEKELRVFKVHSSLVFDVAFSPDEKEVVSAGLDGTAVVCDISTGDILAKLEPHNPVYAASFVNADQIVTAADRQVTIWSVSDEKALHRMPCDDRIMVMDVSPDRKVIAGGLEWASIVFWDAATGNVVDRWERPAGERGASNANTVHNIQFLDNNRLFICDTGGGWILDRSRGKVDHVDRHLFGNAALLADGTHAATEGMISKLGDSLERAAVLSGVHNPFTTAESPNKRWIASADGGKGWRNDEWESAGPTPIVIFDEADVLKKVEQNGSLPVQPEAEWHPSSVWTRIADK